VPVDRSSAADPATTLSGLLHIISAGLGGDLVVWARVDNSTGLVTVIDLVDPATPAQELGYLIRVSGAVAPSSLSARVVGVGEPILMPQLDLVDLPVDAFPAPWLEYLAAHPVHGVIAIPVPLDGSATGLLLAARRTADRPYTGEDLSFVEAGGHRLGGSPPDASSWRKVDPEASRQGAPRSILAGRHRHRFRELFVGAGLPILITAVLGPVDDSAEYHPVVLLLLGCVVAAVVAGVRAAALSGTLSAVALWWAFTPVDRSWVIATRGDGLGIALFGAAAAGVVLLQYRLEAVRHSERAQRVLSESMVQQSPVAMAVFDRQLRYQRVNEPMAEMNGVSAADHVGLRPGDLSPLTGQMYEHLLRKVRDTGQPITNHELDLSIPEIGLERHWRVNYQPLHDGGSEVVGIGAAVMDVTNTIVARRQAERLLALSESLTTAVDEQQIAECLCSFLIDSFQGRALVALRDGDVLAVAALCGFGEDEAARRKGSPVLLDGDNPMAESARTNSLIALQGPEDLFKRYPALDARRSASQDQASLSMPIRARSAGVVVGAMHVGWAAAHPISEEMTTLAETASTLVTHALARIADTEAAHELEFREALDAMLDDVSVGKALRNDQGEIVDFVIEFVNSHRTSGARRRTDGLVGELICDVHPEWRASGMFDRFREVVETGVAYHGHNVQDADPPNLTTGGIAGSRRQSYRTLQVVKFGDGYISASRDVTEVVLAEEASRSAAFSADAERTAIGLLQAAALPRTMPELLGVGIAAVYEPADPRQPVGGDWFDVFTVDDNRVALVIADVAGHGHTAAVFMVQVRNIFRAIAAEHTDPAAVLTRANDVTARLNEPDGPFVTCCFAILDISARTLRWAQAGHFSPLMVSPDGASTYLDARPGAPLAVFPDQLYESSIVDVRPGDRVLMFTDGLVERRREHLDIGLARLATLASTHAGLLPQQFVETLAASVTERFDDLAMMCVDFVGL
jgi:PAS domain S-box-containing protein